MIFLAFLRKNCRRFCLCLTIAGIICTSILSNRVEASVGVVRLDKYLESWIHAAELEFTNFVTDTLTNLDDVKSILDLSDTAFDLKDMVEDFDAQDLLDDLMKDTIDGATANLNAKTLSSMLNSGLNGGDISKEAEDVIKKGAENVNNSLQTGDTSIAASNAYEMVKEIVEVLGDLPRTNDTENTGNSTEGKTVEEQSDQEQSENAIKAATIVVKEVAPISMAGAQTVAAQMSSGTTHAIQQEYAMELADKSRSGAMKEIIKLLAPYTADTESKLSYRYTINKIREQSEKAMERAAEHSKGGPSQALKTIAGLSAVLVEQQNLQNELLISLADILADDIKMTGLDAILSVEDYAAGIQNNIEQYQRIYDRISIIR